MNRGFYLFAFALAFIVVFSQAASAACNLEASLLNQDPYPAVPGSYVKLVFQLSGLEKRECTKVDFELRPKYPFSLDPGENATVSVFGAGSTDDFSSNVIISYDVRVDGDAIDGNNSIEARYRGNSIGDLFFSKDFDVEIQDLRADFEVSVRDYDSTTRIITFDILNVGEHDIEAVTIEIPKQENLGVKGSNRNIIGSLDANEDTSFTFEGEPKEGNIQLTIYYTDEISIRRSVSKSVAFDPSYFEGRASESNGVAWYVYVLILIILVFVGFWVKGKFFKKKARHQLNH